MSITRAEIRRAQVADAAEMARLAGELGYPTTCPEMTRRLTVLLPNERHLVAVAVSVERVLGWMHIEHRFSLEGGDRAELMGLVVDSTARRTGLGSVLLRAAENWALAQGIPSLTVRSNAARESSHPFYESRGYTRTKTQHVYTKVIRARPSAPSA